METSSLTVSAKKLGIPQGNLALSLQGKALAIVAN